MGNLSTRERLKIVSGLIAQSEGLRNSLSLYRKILQIQEEIDGTSTKGTKVNWVDHSVIVELQEKSLKTRKPIIHFLDSSTFDRDVLLRICEKVVNLFIERENDSEGLKRFLNFLKDGKMDVSELIQTVFKEDATSIRNCAEELGIEPTLLIGVIDVLIQPLLEEIARKVDASFSDRWWRAFCPVCGRIPVLARLRDNKRYLVCTFCGAEYLSDRFLCVHCGNKDPYTLKYMVTEGQPSLQIDFCTKCKHYIKVIDESKLREPIPRGLEDILTLGLDLVAREAGLFRN